MPEFRQFTKSKAFEGIQKSRDETERRIFNTGVQFLKEVCSKLQLDSSYTISSDFLKEIIGEHGKFDGVLQEFMMNNIEEYTGLMNQWMSEKVITKVERVPAKYQDSDIQKYFTNKDFPRFTMERDEVPFGEFLSKHL